MVLAMNAFVYLVPIYCAARALSDFRQGRIFWAASGCVSGAVLVAPLFAAFAFPKSEAVAWFMLGFVIAGSVGVAIYVFASTLRDIIERRIGWVICGSLSAILLVLPWAWTIFMPANEMTIG